MNTKKSVSKRFKDYEKRNDGLIVLTFNSHRKMPTGSKGMTDHLIGLPNGRLIFIEDKFNNDSFKKRQLMLRKVIKLVSHFSDRIKYFELDEKESSLEMVCDYINDALEMH